MLCLNLCAATSPFDTHVSWIVSVKVKWGKELFSNVEVNTEEEPMLFKAQLFALTGVQPERQKVMLKGMTLKDDNWGNLNLKDVSKRLLPGQHELSNGATLPRFLIDYIDRVRASRCL